MSVTPVDYPPRPAAPDVLVLGPAAAAIGEALAWLEGLAERDGWPARALLALTLCADEALTNVFSYAQPPADSGPLQVRLECTRSAAALVLRIEDNGAAFDPTAQASPALAPSLDEARVGGHGLRLMRHYLQALDYHRVGERNVLLLTLAWP